MTQKNVKIAKVESTNLNKNLSNSTSKFSKDLLDKLNTIEVKEKSIRTSNFMYQFERKNLSQLEEKKLRRQLRVQRTNLINAILINAKLNKVDLLKQNKIDLLDFQKSNLINQKLEVSSFTQSHKDNVRNEIEIAIQIINSI